MRIGLLSLAAAAAVGLSSPVFGGLIDDFTDLSVAEYTKYTVLDQDAVRQVSFSSPSGGLVTSKSANTQAEQVLFLRGDNTLNVGERLRIDISSFTDTPAYLDFGIAVAAAQTSIADGAANTTSRQGYVAIYANKSQNKVKSISFDALNTQEGASDSGATFNATTFADILGLWIQRDTTTGYSVGWATASGDTKAVSNNVGGGYDSSSVTGTQIGFYGDVRAVANFAATLDNLRIEPIPEPASLSLLAMGAMFMRRRVAR